MNTEHIMQRKWRTLLRPYEAALRRYLGQGPTASLKPALQLGQRAVTLGLETLELAMIHEQAVLGQVLPVAASTARNRIILRANLFFAEAITPLEKGHRVALEANIHLSKMNRALSQRTSDLAASNRELKKEIARRHVVEETLRQSEQHSSRLLEQSRHLQNQLRSLSREILSVQEDGRNRISRELHDVIAQMLTGINVRLATLKLDATTNTKGLSQKITRAQRLVEKSVDIVHRFARELRPAVLDDLGLIPALHTFMKGFAKKTGIRVSLTAFAGVEAMSIAKRTMLYRVAQEALTNVDRHAHASRVDMTIRRLPKTVSMEIKDNGKAFDADLTMQAGKSKRMGLLGMRERMEMIGGSFGITSAPGNGTTIHAQVPFNPDLKEPPRP
ncbi:MAG: histidine kinase [Kiritimatiellaeota bacterium]|nr:histidine kinase [Kiritimatiellota bacterium]